MLSSKIREAVTYLKTVLLHDNSFAEYAKNSAGGFITFLGHRHIKDVKRCYNKLTSFHDTTTDYDEKILKEIIKGVTKLTELAICSIDFSEAITEAYSEERYIHRYYKPL